MSKTVMVIPCFNEAVRLDVAEFCRLIDNSDISLLFVDDGSTDDTVSRLREVITLCPGRAELLSLGHNSGKAEAVRHGMLAAVRSGAEIVGFADADLSTPIDELIRLSLIFSQRQVKVVMGARVRLLGTDIARRPMRHVTGRMFATYASLALRLKVYDTQCGAKFFLVTPQMEKALLEPFKSRWAFDIEFIARLLHFCDGEVYTAADFVEIPLQRWCDVKGSKLTFTGILRALLDVLFIAWGIRRSKSSS